MRSRELVLEYLLFFFLYAVSMSFGTYGRRVITVSVIVFPYEEGGFQNIVVVGGRHLLSIALDGGCKPVQGQLSGQD